MRIHHALHACLHATVLSLSLYGAQASAAEADDYPNRSIKLVVPLSAGTTTDLVARELAERLAKKLGKPVIVDNKPGAGGTVAAQAVAKSAPDGYTLLLVNSQHAINPFAYESLPYDTLRDFKGIALVADAPSVVTVSAALGMRTLAELTAMARSKPGQLNYASSGIGSQTHVAGASFAQITGVTMTHVPYRSSPDVITDLVSNRTQVVFTPAPFVLGQVREGKLTSLAVTGPERLSLLPDVPTTTEAGLPEFQYGTWFGVLAPTKVPQAIIELVSRNLQQILQDAPLRQKFAEQGITLRYMAATPFDAYIKAEMERLAPVIKASGVSVKP